jgi:hypothetical protein
MSLSLVSQFNYAMLWMCCKEGHHHRKASQFRLKSIGSLNFLFHPDLRLWWHRNWKSIFHYFRLKMPMNERCPPWHTKFYFQKLRDSHHSVQNQSAPKTNSMFLGNGKVDWWVYMLVRMCLSVRWTKRSILQLNYHFEVNLWANSIKKRSSSPPQTISCFSHAKRFSFSSLCQRRGRRSAENHLGSSFMV